MSTEPRLGARYHRLWLASLVTNLGDGIGLVAYPWLASAVTRNPLLIAAIAAAQRLPWLVFTLPAGVITDRVDRRRAMVLMDGCRSAITLVVGVAVLLRQDSLPAPDALRDAVPTNVSLYLLVLVATVLLGSAEVLRDNSAQTILPAIVEPAALGRANGRLYAAETVANTFAGPPLGSLLLAVAFALPIFVDAVSFFAAAALMLTIPGSFRAAPHAGPTQAPTSFRAQLREGFAWLWRHRLLRTMAIVLGLLNLAGALTGATFVLFAQEVLATSPTEFAIVTMGGAVGGVLGGVLADRLARRLGAGRCLALTLGGGGTLAALTGLVTRWPAVMVFVAIEGLLGVLWNVITVSLRQSIIPAHLLGRVNSVYRFFAWGMMPIGAALGGGTVLAVGAVSSRTTALRTTWFLSAAIQFALLLVARTRLTTEAMERARTAAA
jgi:MFS family permease